MAAAKHGWPNAGLVMSEAKPDWDDVEPRVLFFRNYVPRTRFPETVVQ